MLTCKSFLLAIFVYAATVSGCAFLQPRPRTTPQSPPPQVSIERARAVEEQRREKCRTEYYDLREQERLAAEEKAAAAQAEAERAVKAACNGSGIPSGTYAVTGRFSVRISVDEDGCAAWEAMNATDVSSARTLRDQHGYYQREYTNQYYCKEIGIAKSTDGRLLAGQTGQEFHCLGYLLSKDEPWKTTKRGAPSISVRTSPSYGGEWVRVPRVSDSVRDDLYAKARRGDYATSVLAARPDRTRGADIDAMYNDYLYDYCEALEEERGRSASEEPKPASP